MVEKQPRNLQLSVQSVEKLEIITQMEVQDLAIVSLCNAVHCHSKQWKSLTLLGRKACDHHYI